MAVIEDQAAISLRVLAQPLQSPEASSMTQILTHGLSIWISELSLGSSLSIAGT
jgi:hypothetical protein